MVISWRDKVTQPRICLFRMSKRNNVREKRIVGCYKRKLMKRSRLWYETENVMGNKEVVNRYVNDKKYSKGVITNNKLK